DLTKKVLCHARHGRPCAQVGLQNIRRTSESEAQTQPAQFRFALWERRNRLVFIASQTRFHLAQEAIALDYRAVVLRAKEICVAEFLKRAKGVGLRDAVTQLQRLRYEFRGHEAACTGLEMRPVDGVRAAFALDALQHGANLLHEIRPRPDLPPEFGRAGAELA